MAIFKNYAIYKLYLTLLYGKKWEPFCNLRRNVGIVWHLSKWFII